MTENVKEETGKIHELDCLWLANKKCLTIDRNIDESKCPLCLQVDMAIQLRIIRSELVHIYRLIGIKNMRF